MSHPMMKCGHAANAYTTEGKPCCVICSGIRPGADEIDEHPPTLTGRLAKCPYCPRKEPSSPRLAFFEHQPKSEFDVFYCGCRGWD